MSSREISTFVPSVRGDSQVVGVFGHPVAHSLSPAMHNAAFAALSLPYIYVPFPVAPENLGAAVRSLSALGVAGVNLTIPHKEAVLPFLDAITEEAREVRAVNTVTCLPDGSLHGDNTDGRGFYAPLGARGLNLRGQSVVVLGAGGAARAVVFRLARAGARVVLANRTLERAQWLAHDVNVALGTETVTPLVLESTSALAQALRDSALLVQTTRVGMHPDENAVPPVPLDALHSDLLVYDLVYNPLQTVLLREAERRGCPTLTGVKMLVGQGAYAFQRWTGVWPPTDVMENAVLEGLELRK